MILDYNDNFRKHEGKRQSLVLFMNALAYVHLFSLLLPAGATFMYLRHK